MKRLWERAPWWRRTLAVLNALVVVYLIASFFFPIPVLAWLLPMLVIEGTTFVILALDTGRRKRDGSYWGPRD